MHLLEIWPKATEVDGTTNETDDLNTGEVLIEEKENEISNSESSNESESDPTKPIDSMMTPDSISAIYLLNPYSILVCLAHSTQIFNTLFVVLALLYAVKGKSSACTIFLALATYMSLYPMVLLAPCILILSKQKKSNVRFKLIFSYFG